MLLWETLHQLTPQDWREIHKCVHSPAFNQREHVKRLWDFFRPQLQQPHPPPLEICCKAAFPDAHQPDIPALRNSLSLLMRIVEEYLILKAHRESPLLYTLRLAAIWRQLGLRRQTARTLKWMDSIHKDANWRNSGYYLNQWEIEQERYEFHAAEQRMEALNFPVLAQNLDIFFLTEKLRQACFAISQTALTGFHHNLGLLPEILDMLQKGHYANFPLVQIYYRCYLALSDQKAEDDFQSFKILFLSNTHLFPQEERRQIFLLAANYCIRRLNAGHKQYIGEALRFYKAGLEDNTILINGFISRFTYGNIVTMAIGEGDLDWARQFLYQYQEKIEPQHRSSTFSFHLARLEYEHGRFDQALPLLQNAEYSDLLINLMAKTLALKIYFQIANFDLIHAHLDAMQNFVTRHKELHYHRDNYQNTLRFVRQLLQLKPYDHKKREKLRIKIEETSSVAEKNWLLSLI